MGAENKTDLTPFVKYFQGPEHLPFTFPGGPRAALLIHGFPGSPAEMRPLGEVLQRAGWTVEGLLLPGFGRDIETLFERNQAEWVEAIQDALESLKRKYTLTLMAGFSLGAALAARAASACQPDGLVLMAPFWKLDSPLWSILPALSFLFPSIRPFRLVQVELSDPRVRRGMQEILPDIDPDDPQVLQEMRNFTIPTRILAEVRKTGLSAGEAAPSLNMPVLVLQGTQDEMVNPGLTRRLALRVPGRLAYREFPTAHDLLDPDRPSWPLVTSTLLDFARIIANEPI